METIRVNMTPCEDVQTIHASQNDGEAREWGFILHNNGEVIDSSEITDQIVFKAYEGGTEQILPENGAVPVTAPFVGDIKYPDTTRNDQEFLYRQSPTEEDGLAKITDIKGNTLVWNQLVQNGNFADTSIWQASNTSFSVSSNVATIVPSASFGNIAQQKQFTANHKYFATCELKLTSAVNTVSFRPSSTTTLMAQANTNWQKLSTIFTVANSGNQYYPRVTDSRTSGWDAIQIRNCMLIDLTQMGLDITDPSDFTSLFPLPYYAYNQGTLLSFNGNGIKTVSKNQFDTSVVTTSYAGLTLTKTQGTIRAVYSGGSQYAGFNFYGSPVFTDTFLKGKYRLSFDVSGLDTQWTVGLRRGASFLGGGQTVVISNDGHYSFTIDAEANPNCYLSFARTGNKTTAYDVTFSNIQLELGTTETSYTPFEEKTISLPISTYFPSGMKNAGDVYDELTETKAITRIGTVDMGTLSWSHNSTYEFFYANLLDAPPFTEALQKTLVCPIYETGTTINTASQMANIDNKTIRGRRGVAYTQIYVKDTSYSSATDLVNALQGILLYYELATPTETSFTTASLVTENAEIPLSNEDGVLIGKCTEQLSSESGFFDAKIKLADEDGECYSNKIQLHIERSPQ